VAHAEVGIRHVRRHLLVARRDQLDAIAGLVERVEHADVAMPADAEHIRDLALDQILGDQLGTLHPRHRIGSSLHAAGKIIAIPRRACRTMLGLCLARPG